MDRLRTLVLALAELRYNLPFVLLQNENWSYGYGYDGSNSSVAANQFNCIQADGTLLDPSCTADGTDRASMGIAPALRGGIAFGSEFNIRSTPASTIERTSWPGASASARTTCSG